MALKIPVVLLHPQCLGLNVMFIVMGTDHWVHWHRLAATFATHIPGTNGFLTSCQVNHCNRKQSYSGRDVSLYVEAASLFWQRWMTLLWTTSVEPPHVLAPQWCHDVAWSAHVHDGAALGLCSLRFSGSRGGRMMNLDKFLFYGVLHFWNGSGARVGYFKAFLSIVMDQKVLCWMWWVFGLNSFEKCI